jgi:GNAT superfamily N-acetyltransferase
MSRMAEAVKRSEAGLEWFAALGTPLTVGVESGAQVEGLEDAFLDIEGEIEVYCDRPPSLSDLETLEALNDRLNQEAAPEPNPRYCNLRGETLNLPTGSTVVEESVGGSARFSRTSELWYRLVITDGEIPVGFCTWVLQCQATADANSSDMSVVVEIGEVWLASQYRGKGIGAVVADRVVGLLARALLELDGRLTGELVPVEIEVGADVYSESGADFVDRVARVAREQLTTVMGLYYGEFSQLVLEVRPANIRL